LKSILQLCIVSRKEIMFTGIIKYTGKVVSLSPRARGATLTLEAPKELIKNMSCGESLCVNGVCLTISKIQEVSLTLDLSPETLAKTALSYISPGEEVNLEEPLKVGDFLGGHIVLGHVDIIAKILSINRYGNFFLFRFSLPPEIKKYVAKKGSIAIDGISLTIAEVTSSDFSVVVIPYTYENTNLKFKISGDWVNIEVDVIARYIETLLKFSSKKELDLETLNKFGFL